ncbi:SDR family NAD(P)-dependent oxidoreductase [Tranquillimonas alkanivorans]|uniref:3-oxoacyl-[acyl-carrier protein] reductase n=1 Tax=Tranquillimonas alkanivorans TaxID=441119 RepID=A0A1I5U7M4_9RHOB|nr:SDR family NAD(P)-dependent oxidoreductase [Tranquillimonas alkanivorans]SFP90927.1 3-oxoacyl-[acyl-carrier protein] reductase [Tranquillimonas alkanivorans]
MTETMADQAVIITGSGQGLGRAFALRFAAEGLKVLVCDIRADSAESVAREIQEAGGTARAVAVDVTDEASTSQMCDAALSAFGRLDILVNNASIFSSLKMRPFFKIPVEEWRKVVDVNLTGVYLASRAAVPAMQDAGRGRIVNIASAVVPMGRPNYLHYVSSKAGVIGLTRGMARELGAWNITVNAVLPGATETEIERETVSPQQREALIASRSIRRAGTPDDLTGVVRFFASEDSRFVTGQSLVVDGGTVFL